ncbi:MAG: nucleotide exchange factor GrpE [Methanobacteriaceae archaeon]
MEDNGNSNNANNNTNNNSTSDLADIENKLDENAKAALDTINIIQEESIKGEALKIISDLSNRANELENEVANKTEEIVDFSSHIQRLQADFDNFKRNADKEKAALTKFANEELIVKIIDSYEDMDRALKNSKNEAELREGLELIYSKLQKTLEKEGLAEIPAEGEKFDHNKHEALMVEDSDDFNDGDIMDELIKGYTLKDKVIKYSKVRVCKKKT